jgi:hypothetical protein
MIELKQPINTAKNIVFLALFLPAALYILEIGLNTQSMISIAAGIIGFLIFNNNYIHESKIKKVPKKRYGPSEAFNSTPDWTFDENKLPKDIREEMSGE